MAAERGGLKFLTNGANRVLTVPNAGGDSVLSEALSAEILLTTVWPECGKKKGIHPAVGPGGYLAATEMEVRYFPQGGAMVDYVLAVKDANDEISARMIGVSVTRAFTPQRRFRLEDARRVLVKKLVGVQFAARNLYLPGEGLDGVLLHVFVRDGAVGRLLRRAWKGLEREVKGSTGVVVTTRRRT
ncbi:hypothetical protein HDU67_009532 [Dinochytrium kinnereticum]|nr:hypothetical protein HDU67_009532 [Dinochytrium kinnereticum]